MNHGSNLRVALSPWFSDWILELSQSSSFSMKMCIKIQFYNPLLCKEPLSLTNLAW